VCSNLDEHDQNYGTYVINHSVAIEVFWRPATVTPGEALALTSLGRQLIGLCYDVANEGTRAAMVTASHRESPHALCREVVRRVAAAGMLLLLATSDAAAQRGTEHAEFWPELQFRYRIDEANSATLQSRLRIRTGPAQLYRAEQTLTVDHAFAHWLSVGVGFEHRNTTNATPFEEERALLQQTLRVALPSTFQVNFRTQEEFRWLLTGFSIRLRERAEVQRPTQIQNYSFTPYASTEVFWDSRFGSFARYRLEVGATLPVYRALSVQPYFMREVNFEGSNIIRDVVGLVLITSF
jgi:hypothetical protein